MRVGIVGGGIGGLATAIALWREGHDIVVWEQAPGFHRVGADINLTPNAVRALDGLGAGPGLRRTAARPTHRISRTWDTGEETSRLPMGETAEQLYGAPQLTIHRADLINALAEVLEPDVISLGSTVASIEQTESHAVTVALTSGERHEVDVLVGADGIHSTVREAMFGKEHPEFTGVVAYRHVAPVKQLQDVSNSDAFTKWWGPTSDIQIVTFPLNRGRDLFIFATRPQETWLEESWTTPGDVDEMRAAYADFHPEAQRVLAACDSVLKSALYVRYPLETWTVGRSTLLGDACHPMMPFMAQGAGQSVEDAVVLARALIAHGPDEGLRAYERTRMERTSTIQIASRDNAWLKDSGTGDWVYGYDAWQVPLE